MDIVVSGRQCHISPEVRAQVEERIQTVERLRDRVIRVEVEFTARESQRDPADAVEVQITLRSKGPVVRAEAHAHDKMQAFELALDRLKGQLRRAADRRKSHRGLRTPPRIGMEPVMEPTTPEAEEVPRHEVAGMVVEGDGPLVVRQKEFDATPLTIAQALDEMELVGHDFFLFQEAQSGRPSVVYRRKAYNYGVIHLNVS